MNTSFKSIAILEDDSDFLKVMTLYAREIGFEQVDQFSAAAEFWEALKAKPYDCIVMDWHLGEGELSGIGLFNRLRRSSELSVTPILVVSGTILPVDFSLLKEFPCSALLCKPVERDGFIQAVDRVWSESLWYENNFNQVKMLTKIAKDQPEMAAIQIDSLVQQSPNPGPVSVLVGKLLAKDGRYDEAINVFSKLLEADSKNVAALNEMGKIALRRGQIAGAKSFLDRAQMISPHNVERLLLLGRLELEKLNLDEAYERFQTAASIDAAEPISAAGMLVVNSAKEFFAKSNQAVSVSANFASLMNATAIAKIRDGAYQEGFEQYKAALCFASSDSDRAKVMFNIALAYLRASDQGRALDWFARAAKLSNAKSADYIRKLKGSSSQGLVTEEIVHSDGDRDDSEIVFEPR